jgi:hypothetical protein
LLASIDPSSTRATASTANEAATLCSSIPTDHGMKPMAMMRARFMRSVRTPNGMPDRMARPK